MSASQAVVGRRCWWNVGIVMLVDWWKPLLPIGVGGVPGWQTNCFELDTLAPKLGSEFGELDVDLSRPWPNAPFKLAFGTSWKHRVDSQVQTQVNTFGSCLRLLGPFYP